MTARPRTARWTTVVIAAALSLGALSATTASAAPEPDPSASGSVLVADPSPTDTDTTDSTDPLTVSITTISPAVLTPQTDLVVTGTVTNTTGLEISDPSVRLRLGRDLIRARYTVEDWATGTPTPTGTVLATHNLPQPLAPGASAEFSLTVTAGETNLYSGSAWGPRRLTIEARSASQDLSTLIRTFVVWCPDTASITSQLTLSVLTPLIAPAAVPETGLPAPSEIATATSEGGRLSRLLEATSQLGFSVAVDPALLPTTPAATTTTPTTQAWAAKLAQASTVTDVYRLPFADTDLSAVAHAGTSAPLTDAMERSDALAAEYPDIAWRTGLAWPLEGAADQATLNLASAAGSSSVVLARPDLTRDDSNPMTYSPTGRADVTTATGTMSAAVSDAVLSRLVSDPAESAALRAQRLVAETAMIALEQPNLPRHLFATTPRNWAPDTSLLAALTTGLTDLPWLRTAPVSELLEQPAVADPAAPIQTSLSQEGAVLPATLSSLADSQAKLADFCQIFDDPEPILSEFSSRIAAVASTQGRTHSSDRDASAFTIHQDIEAVRGSVRVLNSSDLRLIGESVPVPITVANDSDQAINVIVSLRPQTGQVVAEDTALRIEARSDKRVEVPVQAVANGRTQIDVVLLNPAEVDIASGTPLQVQINADWENMVVYTGAVLLVLLLIFGLWRSIRRSRARRTAGPPELGTGQSAGGDLE